MKPSFSLLVRFLGVARVIAQSQNATFVTQEIAKISACGLNCLEQKIPEVGCSFLDLTCQCSSNNLVSITGDCVLANCTVTESLELSKIQAAICDRPYESRNEQFKLVIIIGATISYTSVLLRFISRYFLAQSFGLDDWFALAALCTHVNVTSFGVLLQRHGFGNHIWAIDISTVRELLVWLYMVEVSYILNFTLIKTSILFFYLRVFPMRAFRIQCWTVMAFCVASGTAFTFAVIFQCQPISKAWNLDLKGKCVNHRAVAWTHGGINIFQDILIVLLPVYEIRTLQPSKKKKAGVYAMFGLGLIVCVLSSIRLWNLQTFGITADPTWDNLPTTFWSGLETSVAITCASLPPIRGGFMRLFPNFWKTSIGNSRMSSEKISMVPLDRSPSNPNSRFWSTQGHGSKSTLENVDEEARPPGSSSSVIVKQDFDRLPALDLMPDLMPPFSVPGPKKIHNFSMKS